MNRLRKVECSPLSVVGRMAVGMTEGCVDPDEAVGWVRPITKFCNGITIYRSL